MPPADTEAVRTLLRCSERWARDLTASARERERLLQAEAIERGLAEGKSNRQMAAELGVDRRTVDRAVGGANRQSAEMPHPEADPIREPPRADPVRSALAELDDPQFVAWHKLLEALRVVNGLVTVA